MEKEQGKYNKKHKYRNTAGAFEVKYNANKKGMARSICLNIALILSIVRICSLAPTSQIVITIEHAQIDSMFFKLNLQSNPNLFEIK